MTALDYIEKLKIPSETAPILADMPLPENHLQLHDLFFSSPAQFKATVTSTVPGLQILKMYLEWLDDTKKMYDARNIPESYFWHSLQDIPIWCDDHLVRLGTPGFIEWDWVGKTLRMEVIRIGRLQFEPDVLKEVLSVGDHVYPAGTPILHVHIPAGEPLDLEAVQTAMTQAPEFFKQYFNRDYTLFHCHSWLLSPDLANLLPESSRIIQFKNLFRVYGTDDERQAEERVFGFLSDVPAAYPEHTSLQRAVKQYLISGKEVKMGLGIRVIK